MQALYVVIPLFKRLEEIKYRWPVRCLWYIRKCTQIYSLWREQLMLLTDVINCLLGIKVRWLTNSTETSRTFGR